MPDGKLPEKLNALLLSADKPVVGPKTAAILRAFAAQPEPPLATEGEVEVMYGKLALVTAQAKLSEAEADEQLDLYYLALKDIPADDLRAAFVKLLRTSTFMPRPAEIRDAALRAGNPRKFAKSRARFLAWKHDMEWRPPAELVEPAEAAKLLAPLAELSNRPTA